jgi:cytochrome c553
MAKLNDYRVTKSNARYAEGDIVQLSADDAKKLADVIEAYSPAEPSSEQTPPPNRPRGSRGKDDDKE